MDRENQDHSSKGDIQAWSKPCLYKEEAEKLEAEKTKENVQNNSAVDDVSQSAEQPAQSTQTSQPRDLWQAAYEQLDETQQHILSTEQVSSESDDRGDNPRDLIDEVIQTTKEEYEKYHQTSHGKFKQTSHKIVNAALSFNDIVGSTAALDPTQHAASAWAIVSLGLTMTKNHSDLRDALFESSEYLADFLTYCSFVEINIWRKESTDARNRYVENSLIRLYKAILSYIVQIRKS
ncbi:NACHT and WD40 domain protein [Penicillium odoratum]|uniref:NACHT and WD40 domain protein n=1 Tax=Penicillium odoratum TaxID=1167516 RepID=UPI0025497343|nr:NACHT and WD40 domain protein [Penicillium odoratum]KAJ5772399.1 NACHT and WD40 domain protein [Penicillium odoratum]